VSRFLSSIFDEYGFCSASPTGKTMTAYTHAQIPSVLGILLRVGIAVFTWTTSDLQPDERTEAAFFLAGVTAFSLLPYGVTAAAAKHAATAGAVAGTAALAADLFAVYTGLIRPTSSTAGLAIVFMPVWNLFIFVPAALLATLGFQRLRSHDRSA
jgi:hypothetical protein